MKVYQTLQMALSMFVSVSIFWDCWYSTNRYYRSTGL
jgi:hypothetical protein